MNSENGSQSYSVSPSTEFTRATKLLKGSYKSKREAKTFVGYIGDLIESLTQNPRPNLSRQEPWPANLNNPDWEFRKLVFPVPGRKGAAGEGRLMYLVNDQLRLIYLLWLYTHEDFEKRPPDKVLKRIIRDFVDE